jgi:drug/metabolite transporter (DMT)-like permease
MTVGMTTVAVVLALAAAACFGCAGYLQHASAREAPRRGPLRPRLLLDLLSDRRFAASLVLSVAAFGCQVAALHLAPLALVQPLLATQLLCYLGLVTVRHHRRPDAILLGGALLATVGLVGFLLVSRPASPPPGLQIGGTTALIAGVGLTILTVAALAIGSRLRSEWRAVPFAVACAVFYGVTAALVRSLVSGGIGLDIFTHWELYAIAVVAPMGFLLNQNAFQNGMFGSVAVAIITVGDPAVSIGLGTVWLGESLASGWTWTLAQVLTLIGMAGGVLVLAHRAQVLAERGLQLESGKPAARVVES